MGGPAPVNSHPERGARTEIEYAFADAPACCEARACGRPLPHMARSSTPKPTPAADLLDAPADAPVDAQGAASKIALPTRYEDALGELEGLVARMEAGQLPLDQLLTTYQRGAALLQFCRSRLEAIESQVKVLEEGQPKPWDGA